MILTHPVQFFSTGGEVDLIEGEYSYSFLVTFEAYPFMDENERGEFEDITEITFWKENLTEIEIKGVEKYIEENLNILKHHFFFKKRHECQY